jgi:hypothetical protein
MRAHDVFKTELTTAVASLRAYAETLSDCARVEQAETSDYWRLAVRPRAPLACPFELILYRQQLWDAQIGEEEYVDRKIDRLGLFLPLLKAIVAGRVVTRTWRTPGTGQIYSVETIVGLSDGTFRDERRDPAIAAVFPHEACVASDRHWLPYRR